MPRSTPMDFVIDQLNQMPLASLMLVVALGYGIGRISWRGLSLGPAGGTLGLAILFGSLGLRFPTAVDLDMPFSSIGAFGFALFIYSVGFEAGPRFFSALLGGPGWRFVVVGVVVNVLACGLAIVLGRALSLGGNVTAGLLSGGITSAPTYAAALESVLESGGDLTPLTLSFVLVYPIGLVGIVLLIQFLPRLRGVDLAAEDEGGGVSIEEDRRIGTELTRVFRVRREEVVGIPLSELSLPQRTGCYLTRLHRGEDVVAPHADTCLEQGDNVLVRGHVDELTQFEELVGPEVDDQALLDAMPAPRRVVIQRPGIEGQTLRDLALPREYGSMVVGVDRGDVHLDPSGDLALCRGDVLRVVGRRADVRRAAARLGRLERPSYETDIAVYAGGIFLGLFLGHLSLGGVLGVNLTLGAAGGLLLSGIVLGRLQHVGPFSTHVPRAARQLVRDLGILLFVAETGVLAGGSSLEGMRGLLWPVLGAGVLVAVVPVVLAVAFACRVLRLRPIDAWGSVSGGMTSSAALTTLQRATDGNAPALSYAASYAVASVLATIAGQVVVYVMA